MRRVARLVAPAMACLGVACPGSDEDDRNADRSLHDDTGRLCSWCTDMSCSFDCDPPATACGVNQQWALDAKEVLYLCQWCTPDAGSVPIHEDCHPVVCASDLDCSFIGGFQCVEQRCIFPCSTPADCVVDDVPCENGRCIFP